MIIHGWCLFGKCTLPEALPFTSNAPQLHMQRAHYRSMVCTHATSNIPFLPQPETMEWSKGNWKPVPTLMPLSPMHKIVQVQRPSCVLTMSVDDVVKRKCHNSSCFLYKTKMCV